MTDSTDSFAAVVAEMRIYAISDRDRSIIERIEHLAAGDAFTDMSEADWREVVVEDYEHTIEQLRARLAACEKDAERYRAACMRIRGVGGYTIGIIAQHAFSDDAQLLVGPEADSAIDAAIASRPSLGAMGDEGKGGVG